MAGILYICATPIGNLEDISLRCLRILKEVDLIAAEDTRHSAKLLNHFEITTPMTSYHEHNKVEKGPYLINQMLEGKNVAIVTDAGTPAISDPGEDLVRMCYSNGIEVTSLPGASAVITALTLSGKATRRFCFEGFLPMDKKERQYILDELLREQRTIVLYEAPHRLKRTLKELYSTLGDREVSVIRELTKKFEEVDRTTLGQALEKVDSVEPRGEYVLVIEGKKKEEILAEKKEGWSSISIEEHYNQYVSQGIDAKEALKLVAKDRDMKKRDIYEIINVKK